MALVGRTYHEVCANFRWNIPTQFNIAEVICDRHVGSSRTALLVETTGGRMAGMTFEHVQEHSRRLANALISLGLKRGDRVAILLPQCPETLIAHVAAYRLGAIALPLFTLFGPEAIEYRLNDSGAKVVVSNSTGIEKLIGIAESLAAPPILISIDERHEDHVLEWGKLIDAASADHKLIATAADDPAIIVYTSGTTGNPKGVLYAHRILLGICRVWNCPTISSLNRAIACGRRPIGHGLAVSWTCFCRRFITVCRSSRSGCRNSIRKKPLH
jgi:acetyl-CoA synthetase